MRWSRLILSLTAKSVVRPALGLALLKMSWRFRHREWYRRPPFLPVPDRDYMRWRMYTAYGDEQAVPPAQDVERFARWASKS